MFELLTDRFTEFQLGGIFVPILLLGSVLLYPILQSLAGYYMRGRWRIAAFVPLLPMSGLVLHAAINYLYGGLLWFVFLIIATPLAFLYMTALWLAHSWHHKAVQVGVLATVAGVLILVASRQGLGWKLGGTPAKLQSNYATEDLWVVGETSKDIVEMLTYNGGAGSTPAVQVSTTRPGVYRVIASPAVAQPVELDLTDGLWNPDQFAKLAKPLLAAPARFQRADPVGSVQEQLQDPTPERLVATASEISRALSLSMRSPDAHEAAALVLGAFAMREASGHFQDPRWALQRMTAHLAIARSLAAGAEPGIDGVLAEATALVLGNDQIRALALLDRAAAKPDGRTAAPWITSLRVRTTFDWRLVRNPAESSLLEQSEYFRARREVASHTAAQADLDRLKIDPARSAHWLRLVQNGKRGVDEGNMIVQFGLRLEQREASDVLSLMRGAPQQVTAEDLNARATRCMTVSGPLVLPWGAWAEFSQRHLAMLVGNVNRQFTLGLGDEAGAQASNFEMDAALRDLSLFPVATTFRLREARGSAADLRNINAAIAFVSKEPERVTSEVWTWLEKASSYEAIRQGMPQGRGWFAPNTGAYDATFRATIAGREFSGPQVAAALRRAPYDFGLRTTDLRYQYGEKVPFDTVVRDLGDRLDYDPKAVNYIRKYAKTDAERLDLLARACKVSAPECGERAELLAKLGQEDEAAASYEKAFADPTVDALWLAHNADWLVNYYMRHKRVNDATRLAASAAQTGSYAGFNTMARLDERQGITDEAELLYAKIAQRYDDLAPLFGFYRRRIRDHQEQEWEGKFKELLPKVFPEGMQPPPATMGNKPERGVIVVGDSERSRRLGIQAGDMIVGLEGVRVENLKQYYAVNASYEKPEMTLTVWRGGIFEVKTSSPTRLIGIEFRSYPIQGWAE